MNNYQIKMAANNLSKEAFPICSEIERNKREKIVLIHIIVIELHITLSIKHSFNVIEKKMCLFVSMMALLVRATSLEKITIFAGKKTRARAKYNHISNQQQ